MTIDLNHPTDEMIEAVARAIAKASDGDFSFPWGQFTEESRAAIAALAGMMPPVPDPVVIPEWAEDIEAWHEKDGCWHAAIWEKVFFPAMTQPVRCVKSRGESSILAEAIQNAIAAARQDGGA